MIDPETGEPVELPEDFSLYILATKIYHCLPSQLNNEDHEMVLTHVQYWNAEQRAAQKQRT